MKIRNGHGKYAQRRAISPIIATVLIIAVTLIAAVAIGGFVFGIFGSSSNSAQVAVTAQNLVAANFNAGSTNGTPTCTVAGSASQSTLTMTNTGTSATSVTGVTITWAGAVNSFPITGTCIVAAAGNAGATTNGNPQVVLFATTDKLTVTAVTGQTYTGTVTLGNGAVLIFTGTFN